MPVDPESGGTWIAASDAGLVFTLLNVNSDTAADANAGGPSRRGGLSRGGLIPSLLGAGNVSEALGLVLDSRADRYRPFRLLMMDPYQLIECWLDAGRVRHRRAYLHGAVMRTSSSLGTRWSRRLGAPSSASSSRPRPTRWRRRMPFTNTSGRAASP